MSKFPKPQRYILGESCASYVLSTLELVLAAATSNDVKDKRESLRYASAKVDTTKLLIRLCKDCKCISNNNYLALESKLIEVGKMLGGWIKSLG